MLKKDISSDPGGFNGFVENDLPNVQVKLHKMFNPSPILPSWHIESNRRNQDIHLLYVIKGTGIYHIDQEEIQMKSGQLYIISNDFPHTGYYQSGDLLHMYSMRFGIYSRAGAWLENYFNKPFGLLFQVSEPLHYEWLLKQLYEAYFDQVDTYTEHIVLSHLLLSLHKETFTSNEFDPMEITRQTILMDNGTSETVVTLSQALSMSQKHFTRLFKARYGLTPHQFILKTRMNHGKHLLEDTNQTIDEIARTLNYADPFIFSKQFKKSEGISPSLYRRSLT